MVSIRGTEWPSRIARIWPFLLSRWSAQIEPRQTELECMTMKERIDRQAIYRMQPAIPTSLRGLSEAAVGSGLDKRLLELVKLRASQLNGCIFCLNMHSIDARKLGE